MKKATVSPDATTETTSTTTSPQKGYWELKIPRLNAQGAGTNAYLVFALVILAFFLGMLTNKVMYLEQAAKNPNAAAAAAPAAETDTVAPPPQVVNVDAGKLPVKGDKNAKVTIVEFSDFQCPFCKSFFDDTYGQIDEKYIKTGKVKFTYRHYPLTSIHPLAQLSGEASECANEQGKFWEFHDKLFATQDAWSPLEEAGAVASFVASAGELGMDTTQFQSCVESHKFKKAVDDDANAGAQVQVDGTPAFFVNGYRMTGAQPFSEFERVIEEELKK